MFSIYPFSQNRFTGDDCAALAQSRNHCRIFGSNIINMYCHARRRGLPADIKNVFDGDGNPPKTTSVFTCGEPSVCLSRGVQRFLFKHTDVTANCTVKFVDAIQHVSGQLRCRELPMA